MKTINKTVIVPHTPAQMYNLVAEIEKYPEYLPWCPSTVIKDKTEHSTIATIYIEYFKVKTHFTTNNTNIQNESIIVNLIDGPFKELTGKWVFTKLGTTGCKIDFKLQYKFSSAIFEKLIGPVFEYISKNIVDCFVKEAQNRYK